MALKDGLGREGKQNLWYVNGEEQSQRRCVF